MHTKGPRCKKCTWIDEADSTAGTSFRGVGLCSLHAAAPELLEACIRAEKLLNIIANLYGGHTQGTVADTQEVQSALVYAIRKAEGR